MRRSALPLLLVCMAVTPVAADGGEWINDCGLEPPSTLQNLPAVPTRAREHRGAITVPHVRQTRPDRARRLPTGQAATGTLTGKSVYVSAGHGFTWSAGAWRTQRANTNNIVEDLVSAEAVDQYLLSYLRNMGARVVPIRESDLNPNRLVVDDSDVLVEGSPVEVTTTIAGWGQVPLPITGDDTNPFATGQTRLFETAEQETGRVVHPLSVPETGYYNVYVSYAQGAGQASDAHYIVRHGGGDSHYRVDQRRHGATWVLLGNYWFDKDAVLERSSLALANDSADVGRGALISVDAVRVGGGMGMFDRGAGTSGRPMYENNARYQVQLNGAPVSVFSYTANERSDDVGARSRYAAWDHEAGEDAVYVSWHSNAPNPGTGTSSFTYSTTAQGPLSNFAGVAGSLELQAAMHDEIVADIRNSWDPGWTDRGKFTAFFGEINPSHNPEMPSALFEIAFHATAADADQLRDPQFRRLVSRAMAQGVARYFATRDGVPLTLPPEEPVAVRVENTAQASLKISWRPPLADAAGGDAPSGYRVYTSRNGVAFDEGVPVAGASHELTDLTLGEIRYVRITATNAGGESFPSQVVGARLGAAPILVVGGFDRLDSGLLVDEDLSAYQLNTVERMWLHRMNDGSYASRHGAAIAAASRSFDGTSNEAIEAGDIDIATYDVLDWFVGAESTIDEPLSATERTELLRFFASGGHLFITGSEIGWALDSAGGVDEMAFFRDQLHATFRADNSGTRDVLGMGEPYVGLAPLSFADPAWTTYDAEFPDAFFVGADATEALLYSGGLGGAAGISWINSMSGGRGVLFGFPFETIRGADVRAEVMDRTLDFFAVPDEMFPPDAGAGVNDREIIGVCTCQATSSSQQGTSHGAPIVLAWALGLVVLYRRKRQRGSTP